MVQFTCVKLDRIAGHFVARNREVEQLREVPFQHGIASFRHISHLEGVLDLEQDWDKLFVQLSIFHHESLQGWRLQKLDYLAAEVGTVSNTLIRGLEQGVADTGQMLQCLSSHHLDGGRLLISYLCTEHSK